MSLNSNSLQCGPESFPADWNIVTVGDIADRVGSGITPSGGSKRYRDTGRPFVRSQNVGWGKLLLDDLAHIDDATHSSFASTELRSGDVLLNITGASIGRCAVADARVAGGNVNQHVCIVRVDSTRASSRFVGHLLNSRYGQDQIDRFQAGGNRQGLNFGQVRSIAIPLPAALSEQELIAQVLCDVDTLIESLEQLIAKKRLIKQGAMQELLTASERLSGFDGPWITVPLQDVAEVRTGPFGTALHERDYVAEGTPIITVEHLGERGVFHTDVPMVSPIDCARLQAYSLRVGDIVFSRVGAVDRNALITAAEDGWLFSGRLLRVRPNRSQVVSSYLSYYFHGERFRNLIRSVAVGQTMASLNTRILQEVEVALPSPDEQSAIATLLSDIDAEISALEQRLAKTHAIKDGMMQKLLTGQIRLVAPQTAPAAA